MAYTTIDKPTDYFNTVLWTGNATDNRSITGVGFQPDWVWYKERSSTSWHNLQDVVRGASKQIHSNSNEAEATNTGTIKAFQTDGFQIGTEADINENGQTYVAWNWLAGGTASSNTDGSITSSVSANTTAGFSIVTYTGNGTVGATVGHGLSTPDVVLIKSRSASGYWIFNSFIMGSTGGTPDAPRNIYLNDHFGAQSDKICRNITANTFELSSSPSGNSSGTTYVAYCFKNVKGYQKTGLYTGNGSTDGTFVYTGFKPAFVINKSISTTGDNWLMWDNKRPEYNEVTKYLLANSSSAENTDGGIDILSNGFKCRKTGTSLNGSGTTYLYMAFAENPFVTSTGIPTTAR
jgi:hypothetical protein